MAGGQVGFNYQIGRLVAGVEADGSWGNLKDENFCPDAKEEAKFSRPSSTERKSGSLKLPAASSTIIQY